MEGARKRERRPNQHPSQLRRQGLATTPQDEEGVTIALLDAMIATAHVLAGRALTHPAIWEALKDFGSNAGVLWLIRAGRELDAPETVHVALGHYGCAYQDAATLECCAPSETKNATRALVYPDGVVTMYCEAHYVEGMRPFYQRLVAEIRARGAREETP